MPSIVTEDEIEQIRRELPHELEQRSLLLFPEGLDWSGPDRPTAAWPDDLGSFLDLAQRVGVKLVYLKTERLEGAILSRVRARLGCRQRVVEGAQPLLDEAQARRGSPIALRVSWLQSGVEHVWVGRAPWLTELERRVDAWAARGEA